MEYGNDLKPKRLPLKLYHGSNAVFDQPDLKYDLLGIQGKGFYTTDRLETAKTYGDNIYETELKGNIFDPTTFKATPELIKQLQEGYAKKRWMYGSPEETRRLLGHSRYHEIKKEIDNWGKENFNEDGSLKNIPMFLFDLRYITNSDEMNKALGKLGLGSNYDGIRVPMSENNENHYVFFDPKTLKVRRR